MYLCRQYKSVPIIPISATRNIRRTISHSQTVQYIIYPAMHMHVRMSINHVNTIGMLVCYLSEEKKMVCHFLV